MAIFTFGVNEEYPWALSIYEKNPEISVIAKVEFPIGKKLFHLVVNPGTWPGARPWTWNWYKLQETSMEHDIPFGNSNRENGTTFLDFPLFLGIFQWDEPTKRVPFTAEPEILCLVWYFKGFQGIFPCSFEHLAVAYSGKDVFTSSSHV